MPKRTSINDVKGIEDLNDLERIVKDKRNDKRSDAKKERRNRHYVKVLIKQQLKEDDFEEWKLIYVSDKTKLFITNFHGVSNSVEVITSWF